MEVVKKLLFASATPADYEMKNSAVVAEQVIRPTGLVDPRRLWMVQKSLFGETYS